MAHDFLFDGHDKAELTILLGHGAGGPMDSASMAAAALSLGSVGFRVARFEFEYMKARRSGGSRRPPPKAGFLKGEYEAAVTDLASATPLIIGGKSMGGRIASMVADKLLASQQIVGLLCLGYPFHPIGKPAQLRTAHLASLITPTLICQGTRDALGTADEVEGYELSKSIKLQWLQDGDHDLKPRKNVSGFTAADHQKTMANAVAEWASRL